MVTSALSIFLRIHRLTELLCHGIHGYRDDSNSNDEYGSTKYIVASVLTKMWMCASLFQMSHQPGATNYLKKYFCGRKWWKIDLQNNKHLLPSVEVYLGQSFPDCSSSSFIVDLLPDKVVFISQYNLTDPFKRFSYFNMWCEVIGNLL